MDKKYVCIGGFIKNNQHLIYISPYRLPELYKINKNMCIIVDIKESNAYRGIHLKHLIILYPRETGDYKEYLTRQKLKHLLEKA